MKPSNPVRRHDLVSTARHCPVTSAPNPTVKIGVRLASIIAPLFILPAGGATITFIGGNTTWTDNANTANFSPADEPDADDDLVFNQPNTVSLGSNNVVLSLAMSNGISLDTNDFDLTVDGLLQLAGTGTDLTIGGSASAISADSVTINSGADIVLDGGSLAIAEETGAGLLDLNDGGILSGQGTVNLNDLSLGAATSLFSNSGTLSATAGLVIGSPPAGMLSINAGDAVNARLDLDAFAPVTSVVNVFRNQTLDINVQLNDAYSGDLNLTHNATLDIASPWGIDAGATVDVDNGFFDGPTPITDIPASTSFISGAAFTQTGGTINVADTDGALQFNAPFTMTGGTLVNNGEVIFGANATIGAGSSFTMPTATSSLTVNPGIVVDVDQPDFNADGGGFTTNVITVGSGGNLDLDLGASADESISGTLNLNGGELDVTTADDSWSIDGIVNVGAATGTSQVNGEPVTFTSVPVAVGASSTLDVNAVSTWSAGASLSVGSGASVELSSPVFDAPGTINGAGTLRVNLSSQVIGNTTLAADIFDWDGTGTNSLCTISDGVAFAINTTTFDNDGDMDDNIDLGGNGASLSVSGPSQWVFNRIMNTNTAVAGSATVGGTSRMVLSGATCFLNANGNTTISAPVTFGASSTTNVDAPAILTVNGNAIYGGGNITGPGTLVTGGTSTVSASTSVATGTFDWDGIGVGSLHAVNDGAAFTITSALLDSDGDMDDPISLGGSGAGITMSGPVSWEMKGALTANPADVGIATIGGTSRMVLTTATGILNANGDTTISAPFTFGALSTTNVAAPAVLTVDGNAIYSGGNISGPGTLVMGGSSTVSTSTTVATGTFDWDGNVAGDLHTINDGAVFVINSAVFDSDGDMDDPIHLGGSGAAITMNGPVQWEMKGALTANPSDVGIATIGGTSRMILTTGTGILNANGDTTISAPVTFGASSVTNVAASAIFTATGNAIYDGGTITGAGTYNPPLGNNSVSSSSTISTSNFNFDLASWVIDPADTLTVNVTDYDSDSATNAFDSTLTLNSGTANVTSGDPSFVMDGILNLNNTNGTFPVWNGEPLEVGNDVSVLDADLNVTGNERSQIAPVVTFKSDADVDVAAGSRLAFLGAVNFDTVNGANNAQFTGAGTIDFNKAVNVNEAVTFNMSGGTIDLDGTDGVGDLINIDAPAVINAAALNSFGRINGTGINTLDVDSMTLGASGVLAVNLDSPTAKWTLNAPGVMNLTNDNVAATLLSGSGVNLNGTVNVTGDVIIDARVDIGSTATVNIQTAGRPLCLGGGNSTTGNVPPTTNTINGGTINGPGRLGAQPSKALVGQGTIHAPIDIGFSSDLLASAGTLLVTGTILSADDFGTADSAGVLHVNHDWDAGSVNTIRMQGGILEGGRIDNNATNGIRGHGNVTAKVLNQEGLLANVSGSKLIVQTAGNDNDWDGSSNDGFLEAVTGATLEIHHNVGVSFGGTIAASAGGTVSVKGFNLNLGTTSLLSLTGGTFDHGNSVAAEIAGHVEIGAGTSVLRMNPASGGYTFKATSDSTVQGVLQLDAKITTVETGATFTGAGRLLNLAGRTLTLANLSIVNVLVENRGTGELADRSAGRTDLLDFVQTSSGVLNLDLNGNPAALGSFDRMIVSGAAQLDGTLQLFKSGYVPAAGDTFTLISATGGVSGTFDNVIQPSGMPAGLSFEPVYEANSFKVKVVAADPFGDWITGFASITNPADRAKTANPDHDDLDNLGEFALDGNPASGAASGKIVGKIAPVGGVNALTLTIPVRSGALLDPADPAGGELVLKKSSDAVTYRIQASDNLSSWALTVSEVTGTDATAIQAGLPSLSAGWIYRSFRSPGPVAGDPSEFMRVSISE